MKTRWMTMSMLVVALGCDAEPATEAQADEAEQSAPAQAGSPAAKHAAKRAEHLGDAQVMPDARHGFEEALKLIETKYMDAGVNVDALYTGAIEGMLGRLYQVGDHPVNTLMSPRELEELMSGTEGSIVGVGVRIELVAGVVVVREVIVGGPAAAELRAGDRILGIDGTRVHELTMQQVVDKIRGQAGTEVDLFVQRDTEEWHAKLRRATVELKNVEGRMLADAVGYLRIAGFAKTTPAELDAALADLQKQGMQGLVLDVRHCPGGMLEAAVEVAGRFLAKGAAVLTVAERDGARKPFTVAADGAWQQLPLTVLIGPETASGAEVLADALKTHGRATLIGQDTLGKDSVEHIHELKNGWALKLSMGRMLSASGESRQGKGVRPHLPVPGAETGAASLAELDEANDPALAVAHQWMGEHRK